MSTKIFLKGLSLPRLEEYATLLHGAPRHPNEKHLLDNLPSDPGQLETIFVSAGQALALFDEDSNEPYFIISQLTYIYARYKWYMQHGFEPDNMFLQQCIEHHPVIFDDYFKAVRDLEGGLNNSARESESPPAPVSNSNQPKCSECQCAPKSEVPTASNEGSGRSSVAEPSVVNQDSSPEVLPEASVCCADAELESSCTIPPRSGPSVERRPRGKRRKASTFSAACGSDDGGSDSDVQSGVDDGTSISPPPVTSRSRKRKNQRSRQKARQYPEHFVCPTNLSDRFELGGRSYRFRHAKPSVELITGFFALFRTHFPTRFGKYETASIKAKKRGWHE